MSLSEWDLYVAPKLRNIEVKASWIVHYTRAISENVAAISTAPIWETRAIADAKAAAEELRTALANLDKAISAYDQKKGGGDE